MTLKTEFAPAERAVEEQVWCQYRKLFALPYVRDFLDSVPDMSVVLNEQRQIVFANGPFAQFLGCSSGKEVLGLRPGEAFDCSYAEVIGARPGEAVGCIRSRLTSGGCGTTEFCQDCGAVISILNSQVKHAQDVQECRMVLREAGGRENSLDLRVWSRPIDVEGESFTVFSIMDISDEKRRKALERIFFHDVLNTATGVKGLADLIIETELSETEIKDLASMISESSDQLVEEINAQRMLNEAERGDLKVSVRPMHSLELMCWVIRQFYSASCAGSKELVVDEDADHFEFSSDPVLVRRVLINLVKNALEAVSEGSRVTLNCCVEEDWGCFSVHDALVIPPDVQRQLFIRSFSTKGSGRGLGTYSTKLISERYLKGRVSFSSDEGDGALFVVCFPLSLTDD